MSGKSELLSIAADLKRLADRLASCAKEDDKEEKLENETPSKKSDPKVMAAIIKKKMDNY